MKVVNAMRGNFLNPTHLKRREVKVAIKEDKEYLYQNKAKEVETVV